MSNRRPRTPRMRNRTEGHGSATRAAAWMLVALVAFCSMAIGGREALRGIDTFQLMFWRAAIGLVILTGLVATSPAGFGRLRTGKLWLHGLRSSIHYGAQFSWIYALGLIPLATLFAVEFTCPLWVAVLAPLVLGERLTTTRVAAAVIGFVGILVIVRPGSQPMSLGLALGLAAAIGFAATMICTKRLTVTDDAFKVLFMMHTFQTLIGLVPMAARFTLPGLETAMWIGVVTASGLSAHYALARAFTLADAIVVAPMDFLRLPLIAVVGALFYQEPFEPWVAAGAALIVAANLLNVWGERRLPPQVAVTAEAPGAPVGGDVRLK